MVRALIALTAALAFAFTVQAASGLVGACKSRNYTTVDVDLSRYVGAWYEIARSSSFFG